MRLPQSHPWVLAGDALEFVTTAALQKAWECWVGRGDFEKRLAYLDSTGAFKPSGSGSIQRVIELSKQGRISALGGRDPATHWARIWDGSWRIVSFDVPVNETVLRTRLRRALKHLGFGRLQQSVWITPDGIEHLPKAISACEIDSRRLVLLEAQPAAGETNDHLAATAWDFHRINAGYKSYFRLLEEFPSDRSPDIRRRWLLAETSMWRTAIRQDPLLPDELLPKDYLGKEALARRIATMCRIVS
jgi:DNA-binding transcriptional regulator PaaX